MAGLLDFTQTPEGMQGLALLAAAAPSMEPTNFAGRLALAGKSYNGMLDNQLKGKLIQSQIDENASQNKARDLQAQKFAAVQGLLAQALGQGSTAPAAPGQLGSGSFGILPPAAGQPAIPAAQPAGSRIANMSPDLLAALKVNGIDLVDVAKFARPDMQVSNGYAFDKNSVKPGFLPQLNVAQNGQTSMVQVGLDGMPRVSAPQGALDTYSAYRNADEGTKASYDPTTVTPQGQNPQMTTRASLVRQLNQVDPKVQATRDVERRAILQQEVTRAEGELNAAISKGDQSAAARAQADLAALRRELGGKSPTVGMPLQSDEEKLRATKGVEADASRNVDLTSQAQKSKDTLANIQQARALLSQGPTSSGVGALVDTGLGLVGKSTKSADVASKLDTLSGWMVNNVPRMEGPQSNFDVRNYQTMAGLVGDRTKPLSQRLAALDTLEQLQQKYAHLNGGGNVVNGGGASGSWDSPKPQQSNLLADLPKTAPKGQKVRDTTTGKVLQFNGLSWVEVK